MAWRPTQYLIAGELDNTVPGKVTGWMQFAGMDKKVTFDLAGDFHRDIRGAKIHFSNDAEANSDEAQGYMDGMASHQTGNTGVRLTPEPSQEGRKRDETQIGLGLTAPGGEPE